ncbi:MAG: histidine phosphatase family protein [Candidatus Eisenbacteria bacterium]|nr:histidine phosphatase family protein [Candidatus Eisenbacteria bacterium]
MTGPSNAHPEQRVPVILVRHGVTDWNRLGLVQGWTDIPLSDSGRAEASRLSLALASHAIGRIITSDLARARETAERVAEPHRLPVSSHPELREYHCGEWEGRPYLDIRADDRERFQSWFDDPETPIPGGESMAMAERRATPLLEAVLSEMNGEGALLVVAHGGINRLLAAHLLGMPLESARRLRQDNASISIFEPFQDGWALRLWNGTAHLEGLEEAINGVTASRVG